MTRQHRRSSRSTTATTATTTATASSAGLSFRCVMLVISLVLTPLLASRNVVADALASSSAAAAADHRRLRRRCRPSSSSSSSPPAFPGRCVAVAPVVDDRVGGVAMMAPSISEISSIRDDRVDDGGGGGGGPWWSRIRSGRIMNDGGNGDDRWRRSRVDTVTAAASTAQRGRPRWPRLSGPPWTTMGTKTTSASSSSSSSSSSSTSTSTSFGNAATTDADRPRSESRRRLLPLSLMLLVPGRLQQQRGVRDDRGTAFVAASAIGAIGAIEAAGSPASTTTTTRSSLAIGAALSSLPTAVGKLLQFRIGRVAGVGGRGGGRHHHHGRTIAGQAPPSVASSSSSLLASSSSSTAALSSRGGGSSSSTTMVASPRSEQQQASYYVLETPLFPIILPGTVAERTTTLEISVAVSADVATATAVARGDADVATTIALDDETPSPRMIYAVTRPLVSRDLLTSSALSGTELYHPRSMEALALTGLEMCSRRDNGYVRWAGERGADRFVEDHRRQSSSSSTTTATAGGGSVGGWYETLDASQEVLVWVGKFLTSKMEAGVEYYGSELPVIKTVSVIRKSPKYLAELLMDSSRVKLYNKMSLGRTDVRVFQSGIDTVGGPFGDGESKVVRNLSRPPLVSGIIEFVTCMHGRRLRPEDVGVLGGDDGDDGGDGYIVVSRAVLGGGGGGGSGGSRRRQTSIISTARSWFVTRYSWG